jgi:penicillin-binding protein 2
MLTPADDHKQREQRPQSVQLTLRIALLGAVAACLFALLFFRLWVLQVLSAETYRSAVNANQERTVMVAATRGRILAWDGSVLVSNRNGDAITFDINSDPTLKAACSATAPIMPSRPGMSYRRLEYLLGGLRGPARRRRARVLVAQSTPPPPPPVWRGCARRNHALLALARVTYTPLATLEDRIHNGIIQSPFQDVTLIGDFDGTAQGRILAYYLAEHAALFRGVKIDKRSVRLYPQRVDGVPLAAQIYGEIGQFAGTGPHPALTYPGAQIGDIVGMDGIEKTYDRWLRGQDGTQHFIVDAQGNRAGNGGLSPAPIPGDNLRLTLVPRIQRAAERAVVDGIGIARAGTSPLATAMVRANFGALVVMDVHTGAILAMASNPSFDPNGLVGTGSTAYTTALFHNRSSPLLNRAVSGDYPPGSTFKPVTTLAAMESGLATPDEQIMCDARYKVDGHWYPNFEKITGFTIDLRTALSESCDTYFYRLGKRLYDATSHTGTYQPQPLWMRRLGLGRPTGIDLPGESSGVVPDAAYKQKLYPNSAINGLWTSGDAVNASIGQGYVQVTPLQMAALYALIANGGTLVTPHLGAQVETPQGQIVKRFVFGPRGQVTLDPYILDTIRKGLVGVTHDAGGTAAGSFAGFAVGVAGKTGTAQKAPQDDDSWFVGYAPIDNPQIVAACVIEQGGLGGVAAARAVRDVFAAAFQVSVAASGKTQASDLNGNPIPPDATQIANGQVMGDPTLPAVTATTGTQSTTTGQTTTTPTSTTPPTTTTHP